MKSNNINFIYTIRFAAITLIIVRMVAVTSASRYITSAPRYQSRSSMYIQGMIPRKFTEFAEAVSIGLAAQNITTNVATLFSDFSFGYMLVPELGI